MYFRSLDLNSLSQNSKRSFFLWGPRQVGKSMLLRAQFPGVYYLDLLHSDQFLRLSARPFLLREECAAFKPGTLVIIDEVQKIPLILDEVHWLIENRGIRFALCGSSARKLKRGHGNLLGGRALKFELYGLTAKELGINFDLEKLLNRGYMPAIYDAQNDSEATALLRSYASDYLREEIAAEGLVRNLPRFSHFLEAAALTDTEQLNYSNLARELGVSSVTVKDYFSILQDTLLAHLLPCFRRKYKRRLQVAPKFYLSDVGIVNYLAKRGHLQKGSALFGKAFENWIFHELVAYRSYCKPELELSFWRTSSGMEVDFVAYESLNHIVAIEAKASESIRWDHLKGLREFGNDCSELKRRIIVSLESKPRQILFSDELSKASSAKSAKVTQSTSKKNQPYVEVMPVADFIRDLWAHKLFPN